MLSLFLSLCICEIESDTASERGEISQYNGPHGAVVVSPVTTQQKRPFRTKLSWSFGCSVFFQQSKEVQIKSTGYTELPMNVSVSIYTAWPKKCHHLDVTKQMGKSRLLDNDCTVNFLSAFNKLFNPNRCDE